MAVNFSLEQYNKALKLKDKFGTPEQIAFMNDGEKNLLTNINNYIVNFAGDYQDKIESRPISLGTGGIPETPINEKTEVEKEILTNEKKEVETKVPGIWDKIKGAFKGKDQGRGEEADRGISGKETGLPEQAPTEESKRIRGEETQDIASVRGWDELPLDDEGKRFTNLIEDTEQYLHVMDPRKYYELKEYKEHFSPDNYYKLLDVEIGRATNNIIGKMREEELKEFEQEYGYKPGSAVFDPAAAGEGTHIAMNDPANVMKEREKQEKLVSAQEDAIILDAMIEPFAELPVQQVKQFYDLTIAVLEKINPERAGMQKDFEPEIMELIRRENKVLNKKYPKTFVNAKAAAGLLTAGIQDAAGWGKVEAMAEANGLSPEWARTLGDNPENAMMVLSSRIQGAQGNNFLSQMAGSIEGLEDWTPDSGLSIEQNTKLLEQQINNIKDGVQRVQARNAFNLQKKIISGETSKVIISELDELLDNKAIKFSDASNILSKLKTTEKKGEWITEEDNLEYLWKPDERGNWVKTGEKRPIDYKAPKGLSAEKIQEQKNNYIDMMNKIDLYSQFQGDEKAIGADEFRNKLANQGFNSQDEAKDAARDYAFSLDLPVENLSFFERIMKEEMKDSDKTANKSARLFSAQNKIYNDLIKYINSVPESYYLNESNLTNDAGGFQWQ